MVNFPTNEGKKTILERGYKNSPSRQPFGKIGVAQPNSGSLTVDSTNLGFTVPVESTQIIEDGTDSSNFSANTDATLQLNNNITKTNQSAISLEKSGTTQAFAFAEDTGVSSFDFTNTEFWSFVYFTSSARSTIDTVEFRLGNDASNYLAYSESASNLSDGWNIIKFDETQTTETGSVTKTGITYLQLRYEVSNTSDTVAADGFLFDDLKVVSDGDFFDNFTAGFPSVSGTANEVTIRSTLDSTESVGYNIGRVGVYSDETNPSLLSVHTFPGESKSGADEFNFIIKDRIV